MTQYDIEAIGRIETVRRVLDAAAHHTGMGFVAVAHVTESRWIACAVRDEIGFGLAPGGELPVHTTICNEVRAHHEPVVFNYASEHPQWSQHPTPKQYGFESYLSLPIFLGDGSFFGTLCAIDPRPARLDRPGTIETLRLFAELVAEHLDAHRRLDDAGAALSDAKDMATWRERFIAMVGHDLRSPLQTLSVGVDALAMTLHDPSQAAQLARMRRSCTRMVGLIDNLLDFARGRLAQGIPVRMQVEADLGTALTHVIDEVVQAHPGRRVETVLDVRLPVVCDRERLGQLLTNLLVNAMLHGEPEETVRVEAHCDAICFTLAVENAGRPIPPEVQATLFEPFARGDGDRTDGGLGLGLYIAREIAHAHGGTLQVQSDEDATRFTLRMPRAG